MVKLADPILPPDPKKSSHPRPASCPPAGAANRPQQVRRRRRSGNAAYDPMRNFTSPLGTRPQSDVTQKRWVPPGSLYTNCTLTSS